MQFFWVYIDDLMGKGLSVFVILELLFYVSASLIPLALPLAILLSSIMTFGNLAENNELTALKASGLSLYKIIKPLMMVVIIIAMFTFYFANYVIPVANLKWHSLIYDIQNTKISSIITPGVYSKELDGYAIKVEEGSENHFKGIIIHDHTTPNVIKTIKADEGNIYKSKDGDFILFELKNGYAHEELAPKAPDFLPNGKPHNTGNNNYPSRRSKFKQSTYKIDISGFDLNRSREDLFKDKHEMMNVFQLQYTVDSVKNNAKDIIDNFVSNIWNSHPYANALSYKSTPKEDKKGDDDLFELKESINFNQLDKQSKIQILSNLQSTIRSKRKNIKGQEEFLGRMLHDLDSYLIEFHRKFALTIAIIILFFIGAPLGAIVKKGGFGAPVVIAALLFMVYFVLITIGDNLAMAGTISPWLGMWFASIVLAPIAFILMRAAANDRPVFSRDKLLFLSKLFSRKN